MNIIEMIAQDVFDKVRSRFSNLEMGDGEGNTTNNPKEARFFDFDFAIEGNTLGRVSVSINDIGTLKVYYGQGITEGTDSVIRGVWYDFLKEMRMFAMRRMLRFDTRDINKGNLNKNDFQYLATNGPKESNMTESQYFGSSKTSYRALENTKLIIKHSQAVNETQPGARSRHISALFIENSDGERFKYPFNHLSGAKAMQRHVANGGRPYDDKGTAIIDMSESIIQLNVFKRQAAREGFVNESTQDIFERAMVKLEQLRQDCTNLSKQTYYENWSNNFKTNARAELDEVTLEDYKDKFTVRQFEDNLTSIFPLLHAIMQETSEIDLADVIESTEKCDECGMMECECDHVEEANDNDPPFDPDPKKKNPPAKPGKHGQGYSTAKHLAKQGMKQAEKSASESFEMFDEWADAIVEGYLEPDTIMALKDLLDNGLTLGADATSAVEALESIGIHDEDLADALEGLAKVNPEADPRETIVAWVAHTDPEAAQELSAEPAAEPAPEPAPVEPAPEAPVEPAPEADPAAMAPAPEAPVAEDEDSMDNEEPQPQRANMREIAEVVKSFYDRETGRFPKGETGVVVHCKKMFGDQGGQLAERLVAHLSQRSHQQMAYEDITRMLKLAGIKEGVEKSQIPAYKRKEKGGDWKMSTKDLEDEKTKSPTSSAGLARKKKELGMSEESHQSATTMKHVKNPTKGEKQAAKDIKPGIAGYRDRIDMLQSAKKDGRLKNEASKPSAGLSKGQKSSIAKKARAGSDIGKPGKSFDKVAKAAGGGEKGKKIAAAAMWKNAAR
jgi:hypothetical protein